MLFVNQSHFLIRLFQWLTVFLLRIGLLVDPIIFAGWVMLRGQLSLTCYHQSITFSSQCTARKNILPKQVYLYPSLSKLKSPTWLLNCFIISKPVDAWCTFIHWCCVESVSCLNIARVQRKLHNCVMNMMFYRCDHSLTTSKTLRKLWKSFFPSVVH